MKQCYLATKNTLRYRFESVDLVLLEKNKFITGASLMLIKRLKETKIE